ncbi:MAG: response regulator [Gammaproteobacteria bacterium]|nr:response regulator [Gammaproteobacteria bacterium]
MSASKHFLVGIFGVPELERQVLERIFSLSASRANVYRMLVDPDGQSVDILLVDRLSTAAAGKAEAFASNRIPVVSVIREKESNEPYFIRRPFTATRTLGVLDRVVEYEIRNRASASAASPAPASAATPHSPAPGGNPRAKNSVTPPAANSTAAQSGASPPARRQVNPADSGEFQKTFLSSGYRALVVDDSLPVRKQVSIALERSGISADFAEDGETALTLVAKNDYEIIFLDVMMPGVDGYEVCKAIKRDKRKKNIPIVMLTGKSSPFDKVKGKLSGCDTYLTKPVGIREFNRTLNKCLKEPIAFDSIAGLT